MANYDVESHIPGTEKCFYFLFLAPYARTTRYEEAFCLKAKNGLGRFAPSALPQASAFEFSRIFRRDRVGKNKTLEYFIYFFCECAMLCKGQRFQFSSPNSQKR